MSTYVEQLINRYRLNEVIERFSEFAPELIPVLLGIFNRSFEFTNEEVRRHFAEEFTLECCTKWIEYDERLRVTLMQPEWDEKDSEAVLTYIAIRIFRNGVTSVRDERTLGNT